jgi:hypothetical protein
MLGWLKKRRNRWKEGLLTEERARAIIEAEIRRRDWEGYDRRSYALERRKGRPLWICWGFVGHQRGGVMAIYIDARTGELIEAKAGGR